jgi:hypothetical protein
MAKAKIRSSEEIAKKWARVTPGRSADYAEGIENPLEDWERNTVLAQAAYKAGISAVDIAARFLGGVKRAGTAKWKRKAKAVGPTRFAEGVAVAEDDFRMGFDPFQAVIAATDIPDRKPRGDPANYERSKKIGTALNKKRLALLGAGGGK